MFFVVPYTVPPRSGMIARPVVIGTMYPTPSTVAVIAPAVVLDASSTTGNSQPPIRQPPGAVSPPPAAAVRLTDWRPAEPSTTVNAAMAQCPSSRTQPAPSNRSTQPPG